MIVSVRWPTSPPVARSFSCSAVRPARLSEPTMSQFVPDPVPALSAGRASTRLSEVSTQTPKPTTASSSTSSSTRSLRPQPPTAPRSTDSGWAARRLDGRTVGNALTRRLGRRHHRGRPGRVRPGRRGWGGTAAHGPGRARRPGRRQRRRGRPLLRGGAPGTAPRPGGPPRTAAVVTAHVAHHPASVRSRPSSRFARYAGARRRRRGASTRQTASRHRMASECSGWGTGPVPQVVHSLANSCRLARTNVPTRADERADSRVRRGRAGGTAPGRRRPGPPAPAG